jgi:hypothetical protein
MSRQAIESAIAEIATHPNPDMASGLAEGLVIAYFTSQIIDSEEFKTYCAQIRAESLERQPRKVA